MENAYLGLINYKQYLFRTDSDVLTSIPVLETDSWYVKKTTLLHGEACMVIKYALQFVTYLRSHKE